nr:FAD-dependent oxidoreductase [Bacillota bacterium]
MAENVDLVILGAGPGGYVAAIRASQLGLKTVMVEKEKVGGVCLHKGCIPSKSLLRSAELFHQMKQSEDFGIRAEGVRLDMEGVQKRKNRIREQLHQGVQHLLKKNGVRVVKGTGRILGPSIFSPQPGTISVEKAEESEAEMLVPQNIIIATGSRPRSLPGLTIDGEYILHSDHVLEMEQLPESMVILGGGVIGLEWASMLNDFGVEVTVVEAMDRILPQEDPDVNKEMTRLLKKRNVEVLTEARLIPELVSVENGRVAFQVDQGGRQRSLDAEKMLVAVGRQPNTEDIGLQNTSIRLDRGFISVNSF